MASLSLIFDILAVDRASSVLRNVGRAGTRGGAVVAGAMGVAALAVTKFGLDAVQAGSEFDATLRQMGAVANVPQKGLKELSELALKMGEDTKFSAGEAAQAMLELSRGGLSVAQIKGGALQETLTLAAAGSIDLADAAETVNNALGAFGLKAKDAGQVSAALAGAANASSASVDSLRQGLAQVGPGARNAGLSIQETTAALAAFANAGLQGSDAGTSLKTFLTTLVPKTTAAYNEFARLGLAQFDSAKASKFLIDNGIKPLGTSQEVLEGQIRKLIAAEKGVKAESAAAGRELDKMAAAGVTSSNAFFDAAGSTKSLADISGILQQKLGGLSEEEKNRTLAILFGSDATRAATILMNEGSDGLAKYIKSTSDSAAAQRVAKSATEGAKGAVEQLKGSYETLQIRAGVALAPVIEKLALLGATMLNNVVPAGKRLGEIMDPLLRLAFGAVKAVADVVVAVLRTLTEVYQNNRTTVESVIVSVGTLTLVMNAGAIASGLFTVAMRAYIAAMTISIGVVNSVRGAVIAFNLALAANPIGVVTALIIALGAGLIYAYNQSETFRRVVTTAFDKVLGAVNALLGAYEFMLRALGKVPGFGWATTAANAIGAARDKVDGLRKSLDDLPSTKTVKINMVVNGINSVAAAGEKLDRLDRALGDGPGASAGGRALARVQSMLPRGAYVTSTLRTPAENARVGGSPTSYHLDRRDPAVDIGGPKSTLNSLHRTLQAAGGWRELLWQVPGHYDHIHVAHSGGTVSPSWASMPGLRADERPAVLQVGEEVLPVGGMASLLDEIRQLREDVKRLPADYRLGVRAGAY